MLVLLCLDSAADRREQTEDDTSRIVQKFMNTGQSGAYTILNDVRSCSHVERRDTCLCLDYLKYSTEPFLHLIDQKRQRLPETSANARRTVDNKPGKKTSGRSFTNRATIGFTELLEGQ